MGVKVELQFGEFESKLLDAVGDEMVKAGMIFRRNLSTVLRTSGKSPPPSPDGSYIPYNQTGTLARSWMSSKGAKFGTKTITVSVGTNLMYAKFLVQKTGKGKRNYISEKLAWRRKTKRMMLKRLDAKRLITSAIKSLTTWGV